MSPLKLIIGIAVWSASIALAFFIGQSGSNKEKTTSDSVQSVRSTSLDTKAPSAIADKSSVAAELTDTVASEAMETYFAGDEMSLTEALANIQDLSSAETKYFLEDAFALPSSDPSRAKLITALLQQLAKSNPQEAYEMTASIDSLRDMQDAKVAVLEVWAKSDPVAALNWAQTALADQPQHLVGAQMRALYRGYASLNPQAAFTAAQALPAGTRNESRLREQLMGEVIETQVREGNIEQAKLAIELMTDDDARESMTRELVGEWAQFDPTGAAAYVESLGENASMRIKTDLVDEWAAADPAAAAEWLSGLDAEDPAVARAATDVIQEWTRYDLTASAEWLNSLPASPELDRAVATYTYRAAQENPETAMTWAESISSDWGRNRMMQSVAATWKETDPAALETYVQSGEFTDEQKEQLLNAESRRGGPGGGGPGGGGRRR